MDQYTSRVPQRPRVPAPRPNELTGVTPPTTGTNPTTSLFSDPYTKLFEDISRQRINTLSQPFSDPGLEEVLGLIRGQIGNLQSSPGINFGGGNSMFGDFISQGQKRIAELNQAPFTSQEEAAMKTKTQDTLAAQRDQARQRATEDVARLGQASTSGTLQARIADVEKGFESSSAKAQNDQMLWIADQAQQRKNQATTIAQQLAAMGAQEEGMANARGIASANYDQSRNGAIMSAAGMLADIAAQKRGEQRANQNDVLQIAQQLSNLTPQRLALAMNVLNGSGGNDLSGLFTNTLNLSNTQASNAQNSTNASSAFMQALAKIMSYYGAKK